MPKNSDNNAFITGINLYLILDLQHSAASERDRLVVEHLPLARAIAARVNKNLPSSVDLDDLVHAGILGLFDAALKYNENKQVIFRYYAKHRVKGAILDSLRDMDWASHTLRKRHKLLEEITREMSATRERGPTPEEIADKMGIDVNRWNQVAVDLRIVGLVSGSTYCREEENRSTPEFPATADLNPEVMSGKHELRLVLCWAMKSLPERHQAVIALYYSGDKTMKEIGDSLGVNESRVSQIHRAALQQMARNLRGVGIHSAASVLA
jgi:RNA polymerase sigma factor for flagellar operon FliA